MHSDASLLPSQPLSTPQNQNQTQNQIRPSVFGVIRQALSEPPHPQTAPAGSTPDQRQPMQRRPTIYGRTEVDLGAAVGPVPIIFSANPPPPPLPQVQAEPPPKATVNAASAGAGDVLPRPNFFPKAPGLRPRSRSFSGLNSTAAEVPVPVQRIRENSEVTARAVKRSLTPPSPSPSLTLTPNSTTNSNSNSNSKTSLASPPLRPSPLPLSHKSLKPTVSVPVPKSPSSPLAQSTFAAPPAVSPVPVPAPSTQQSDQSTKDSPKIWKCGDPYVYPIPMPSNGNPWTTVLGPHLKNDKVQCDAWKDEVQNLLIFAGLFSAVVTSFAVESYRNLQADPNNTIIYLLNQLVETSTNTNATSIPRLQIQQFTVSPSSIRVNIFWFLSLVLSLTTVLVGIVSLQWIREHQKYTDQIESRAAASVFQMRSLGLDEWYIHHIFTALPLLLQGALILFFMGIVDFLFALNHAVASYVTAAVALTLFFFFATTALPTLQLFVPLSRTNPGRPPVQCPYRSPQSWIFLRLSSYIYRMLLTLHHCTPFKTLRAWFLRVVTFHVFERNYPGKFGLLCDFKSWILFDSWWRNIREARARRHHASAKDVNEDFYDTFSTEKETKPTGLEAKLLLTTLEKYSSIDEVVFSLYHCVDEVVTLDHQSQYELFQLYYIQPAGPLFPGAYWPSQLMAPFKSSSARMMREESLVWFLQVLGRQGHSKSVDAYIASHLIELKSRITAYTLSSFRHITSDVEFMDYTQEYMHYTLGKKDGNHLEHQTYGEVDFRYPVSDDLYQASLTQAYLIYDNFAFTMTMIYDESGMQDTTYNHMISLKFLDVLARLFTHAVWNSDKRISLHPIFCKTLESISSTLDSAISDGEKRPLLFLSTAYLIHRMLKPSSKPYYKDSGYYRTKPISEILPWVQSTPIGPLLDALIKYNERFKPTRNSPFPLKQLSYEAIYLWQVGPSQELVRVLEIPHGDIQDK